MILNMLFVINHYKILCICTDSTNIKRANILFLKLVENNIDSIVCP